MSQHVAIFIAAGKRVFPAPVNTKNKVNPMASKYCSRPIICKHGMPIRIISGSFEKMGITQCGPKMNKTPILPIIIRDHLRAAQTDNSALSGSSSPRYLPTKVAAAIPTPTAGIKEAWAIFSITSEVASSTVPIVPIIL